MITCRHAVELTSRALDEQLNFRQRLMLWFHRRVCGLCRRFGQQLEHVNRETACYFCERKAPLDATLSEDAKHRISRQLHAHDEQS